MYATSVVEQMAQDERSYSPSKPRRWGAVAAGALGLALIAPGAAHAVLPNAVSYEYFGFNFAMNVETSDTVGTLDYTGKPGCGSSCIATTALGADPSTLVNADEVVYMATSGGYGEAKLGYYFE